MSASLRPLVLLLPVGVVADQLSKRWAEDHVRMRGVVTLVPDLLDLRYARNPGAFFSLGADLADTPRRVALIAAGVSILGLMLWMYFRTATEQVRVRWALALLAAGAIGNLVDRVRVGEVVDFVYLHVGALLHWATFNVADVLITAGLLLLGLDLVRPHAHAPLAPQPGANGGH
ncbi:MAG: signal peptidase II [Polyangiales bacterium]